MRLLFQYIIDRSKWILFISGLAFVWLGVGFVVYPLVGGNPTMPVDWYRWYGVVGLFLMQGLCGGMFVGLGLCISYLVMAPLSWIWDDYREWESKHQPKSAPKGDMEK